MIDLCIDFFGLTPISDFGFVVFGFWVLGSGLTLIDCRKYLSELTPIAASFEVPNLRSRASGLGIRFHGGP